MAITLPNSIFIADSSCLYVLYQLARRAAWPDLPSRFSLLCPSSGFFLVPLHQFFYIGLVADSESGERGVGAARRVAEVVVVQNSIR